MQERWIRCIECDVVARVTEYDRLPHYSYDQNSAEVVEKLMDDEATFMGLHKRHTLEELFVVKDSFISNGRYGEPLKVNYFEATNGKERFVIKGWRDDVNKSMEYQAIPGYIETNFTLEVQTREIRKQIGEEIKDPQLADTSIERFIQIVETVVSHLPVRDPLEITAETDTPLVSHCKFGASAIREVMALCKNCFNEVDVKRIEQFVHRNNTYNDPMTLLLKRTFSIKQERPASYKVDQAQEDVDRKVLQGKR
jgi:hypothetical protein